MLILFGYNNRLTDDFLQHKHRNLCILVVSKVTLREIKEACMISIRNRRSRKHENDYF